MYGTKLTNPANAKMREGYIQGTRVKGFQFTTVQGTDEKQLTLSGLGKSLLGVMITGAEADLAQITISLKVNNDVILEKVNAQLVARDITNPRQFFDFYRPLTGQDDILITFTSGTAALNFEIDLYYTQAA